MNKNEAWNKFKKSGRIEDYLAYAKEKKCCDSDNKSRGDHR